MAALAKQNAESVDGQNASRDFFGLEYQLDHLVATYSKPYISIMDGITMGGGVGLSVHAPFRIATENTLFAMPETAIGFYPEVGASFFLPRLDGELGTYLGLTSERLKGEQAFYAGIATHYLHSTSLANLVGRLSELVFPDSMPLQQRLDLVNRTIAEYHTGFPEDTGAATILRGSLRQSIDRCFAGNSVEGIIHALEQETENKEWAQKTLETLVARSPTSLKVALRQLRIGRAWSIAETFQREHKISGHFMFHPDFVSGVSARLLHKPPTTPVWQPGALSDVSDAEVDRFFRIAPGESRLPLLHPGADYTEYPHARFALPRETDIAAVVRESGKPAEQVVQHFLRVTERKAGVRQKVEEVLARKTESTGRGLRWVS